MDRRSDGPPAEPDGPLRGVEGGEGGEGSTGEATGDTLPRAGYRPTPVTPPLSNTPLFDEHVALGGRMVPFAGYRMPVQYRGVVKEHHAVRGAAGLFDVCHMGELTLTGKGAVSLLDRLVTNDIAGLGVGQARYTVCCNEEGFILDDLIVYRRGTDDLLVVCNASNRGKIAPYFAAQAADAGVSFADVSAQTGLLALQGPRALTILEAAGGSEQVLSLGSFRLAEQTLAGAPCTIARTGYTGEDGVEIFCPAEGAVQVWRALLEAGQEHGLAPAGLGARDTLRLEARLSLYGNDIDETTHPLEAGLGWVVKLDKGPFVGRDALRAFKERGLTRRLVGFEMVERGIARHGYPIFSGADEVGIVTSGSPAPSLGKNIGLGYVPLSLAKRGSQFTVAIRDKRVRAEVVKTPFYRRAN